MMRALVLQTFFFIAVGTAAAITHWGVAVLCVEQWGIAPLIANIIGWLVAFSVSFTGHYRLTFRHQAGGAQQAAMRFFVISATGFAINEASYAFLMRVTALRYDVLLFFILIAVAVLTFIFSRFWAFRRN